MKLLKYCLRTVLESLWFIIFRSKLEFGLHFLKFSKKILGFNLDLHISVIQDLLELFSKNRFRIIRWSISSHNFVFRKIFRFSDPVSIVNSNTWRHMDAAMIRSFSQKHKKFLRFFDFFLVTHTPSFVNLYRDFDKPILCVNSTRYEAPYTLNFAEWKSLNRDLLGLQNEGKLTIWSNNRVDKDYLFRIAGVESQLVPSLCSYVNCRWNPSSKEKLLVYMAKSETENAYLKSSIGSEWLSLREALGEKYVYRDLAKVNAIFFLPYQLSTMSLFELATMGVPVIVPSPRLVKKLINEELPILTEILYAPTFDVQTVLANFLDDSSWISDLDWWLERADFYDRELMPNVIEINDLADLQSLDLPQNNDSWRERTEIRNQRLKNLRQIHFERFLVSSDLKK